MNIIDLPLSQLTSFQPKQKKALETLFQPDCKYLLYGGAAFGGKSYFLRWTAVTLAMYYFKMYGIRHIPIGLFSEDYPTLKDRQITKIKREMPSWLGELKDSRDEGYMFELKPEYGSGQILLRNLDDPSKYASTEFAAELVEEITKNPESTFDDLRFRLRYPGIPDPKFVAATNPGQKGHEWVKRKWVRPDPRNLDKEQSRFFYIQALPTDNELIDEGYLDQLRSLPERKRKMLLEGSWDVVSGQAFPQFIEETHVIKEFTPNTDNPHYLWIDWGFAAPAYFAAYLSTVIPTKLDDGRVFNRVITYQEWYLNDLDIPDISPRKLAEVIYKEAKIKDIKEAWCDPSMFNRGSGGGQPIADRMKKAWKDLRGGESWFRLNRANNDRSAGWSIMQDWMNIAPDGMPYWMVTRNCHNLISTLPNLVYDENKLEKGTADIDTTQNDHGADSCRYGLVNVKFIALKPGSFKVIHSEKKKMLKTDERGYAIVDPRNFFDTI